MQADNLSHCFNYVEDAAARLHQVAHKTPIVSSRTLNQITGARAYLKCENLQRIGAFKFRGAYNAISHLSKQQLNNGVITVSSGNHGQAVALVSQLLGAKATVVMPSDAPDNKRQAIVGYAAHIIEFDRLRENREQALDNAMQSNSATLIPPYDDPFIVAGQGTAALELLQQADSLDLLLVPCGGGGLLSGSVITAKSLNPRCRVIGVEPALADDALRSFKCGTLQRVNNPDTIADGTRTESLGEINFEIIKRYVDDMVSVSEQDIINAMRFLLFRTKLLVEPSGVLGVAALLCGAVKETGRVGIILSGGNVDGSVLQIVLNQN